MVMKQNKIRKLFVLGEKHGNKRRWRLSQCRMELDKIAKDLSLTKTEKEQVMYIIKNFGLKRLNRRASKEKILVALAFFVKSKNAKHGMKLEWYKCVNKVKLTYDDYITILTNLINAYMQLIPLNGLHIGDTVGEFH